VTLGISAYSIWDLRRSHDQFKIPEALAKYGTGQRLSVRLSGAGLEDQSNMELLSMSSGKRSAPNKSSNAEWMVGAEDDVLKEIATDSDGFSPEGNEGIKETVVKSLKQEGLDLRKHVKCEGVLLKRSERGAVGYQERFVTLDGTEFAYYRSEESFSLGELPRKSTVFSVKGYEVIVGASGQHHDFSLHAMDGTDAEGKRNWEFRAKSEEDRVRWVQAFLASTMQADYDIDDNHGRDTILSPDGGHVPMSPLTKKSRFWTLGFN